MQILLNHNFIDFLRNFPYSNAFSFLHTFSSFFIFSYSSPDTSPRVKIFLLLIHKQYFQNNENPLGRIINSIRTRSREGRCGVDSLDSTPPLIPIQCKISKDATLSHPFPFFFYFLIQMLAFNTLLKLLTVITNRTFPMDHACDGILYHRAFPRCVYYSDVFSTAHKKHGG